MKNDYPTWIAAVVVSALSLLAPLPGEAQLPKDPVERAKVIAQIFQANARQLTLFDREGKEVGLVGPRDLYQQPVLSPDRARVAVIRADLDKGNQRPVGLRCRDGQGIQITSSQAREGASSPAWSPDGRQVAYAALRGPLWFVRKASNGEGAEGICQTPATR